MHAVFTRVTIDDRDTAEGELRDQVVPGVRQAPGFQAGYWTAKGNDGLALIIFDSEEAAEAAAGRVREMARGGVTVQEVEVREVVASA